MIIFNPLRPFLGLASIVLLSVTLFLRLRALRYGCSLPTQKTVADEEWSEPVTSGSLQR